MLIVTIHPRVPSSSRDIPMRILNSGYMKRRASTVLAPISRYSGQLYDPPVQVELTIYLESSALPRKEARSVVFRSTGRTGLGPAALHIRSKGQTKMERPTIGFKDLEFPLL